MSKIKTITEQIEELQAENDRLQALEKLFEQAVKKEFGYCVRDLHKIVDFYTRYQRQKTIQNTSPSTPKLGKNGG